MQILVYEFVLSLRRLVRRPLLAGLMLATFTVSITLTLLSWSLFHTMFLRNPEFDPQGGLYRIAQTGGPIARDRLFPATREDIAAWQAHQTVFSNFAMIRFYESVFVNTEGGQERLLSANVSAAALRMVNAQPLLGRLFTPEEDQLGSAPVVLISEKTWRNRFAADPAIIGRVIKLDGVAASIVGVMPAAFRFPNEQELWQSQGFVAFEKGAEQMIHDVIVRLKPGVTPGRAAEDLRLITERRGKETMAAKMEMHRVVSPFREYYLYPELNQSALILFCLAAVFILVGCANAANLVMIDFFGRTGEIASSLALGIPRAAAVRSLGFQLLATATLAAAIGTALLLALAPHIHAAMARITTPYWLLFTPQWHHFALAAGLAVLSAGVAMIVPLGYLSLASPERIIRDGAGASRATGRGLWRRALIVGQIGLLTVLGVSAGLLLRSSHQLRDEQWGFDARKIFVSKTAAKETDFPSPLGRLAVHQRLLDEIERLPGVAAAALMTNPVGFSGAPGIFYAAKAEGLAEGRSEGGAFLSMVTPNIFTVFDAEFIEGETFAKEEKPGGPIYVVINHSLAAKLWPGQAALGRVLYGRGSNPAQPPVACVVRGVVRDFQACGPKAKINDFIFLAIRGGIQASSFLYARGQQTAPVAAEIRAAAVRVDPRMAIYFPGTVQEKIELELSWVRLTTRLTLAYALTAVLLCIVGVYSITVSQVWQLNREFGIRMALGIDPAGLWSRFVRGHLLGVVIAVALGLGGAVAVAQVLRALLFGVSERDPLSYALAASVILLASSLACIPSYYQLRRINPADCLRSL